MSNIPKKSHQNTSKSNSKLLIRKDIDEADELDLNWIEHFKRYNETVGNKPEAEVKSILQQKNLDRKETAVHYCTTFLYGILTEEDNSKYLRFLNIVARDGYTVCISQLKHLVNEKYTKMLPLCKENLLWLIAEFVKLNVRETDILCCNLLRQIPGGDASKSSIWLVEKLLNLFIDNKGWLYMSSELIRYAVYTFTRILSDHNHPSLVQLKEKEVRFCIEVIREKFAECRVIGRDFVRLLQDLTKIPQFSDLWKDILQRPQSLSSQFTDLSQLFATRTPRLYLQSRVTPDMEKLLLFIMQKVTMGNQKRYQAWFAQSHLSTPESESLIVDLIRYICCVYHPSNVILSSDIVPRWAVIGWLLNSVKTSTIQANAKLALFYDWFYFNPQVDNIMNIEPGMLLMIHSIPKYAPFSAQLLEFIIFVMEMYYPAAGDIIKKGVRNSLQIMLSKGVVHSLEPLVDCPTLDIQIRQKIINCFAPFLPRLNNKSTENDKPKDVVPKLRNSNEQNNSSNTNNKSAKMDIDNKDEIMTDVENKVKKTLKSISDTPFNFQASKLSTLTKEKAPIKSLLPVMRSLLDSYCSTTIDLEISEKLNIANITASFLLSELSDYFCTFGSNEYLTRINNNQDELPLIDEIHKQLFIKPRIGYHFLIYLSSRIQLSQKQSLEIDKLAPKTKLKKLKKSGNRKESLNQLQCLLYSIPIQDLINDNSLQSKDHFNSYLHCINKKKQSFLLDTKLCAETDSNSFFWMVPQLCCYFSFTHSSDFVNTIVSYINPYQLSTLLGRLIKGNVKLLDTNISTVLLDSLNWGSYEQTILWQIVKAECSSETINSIIPQFLDNMKSPDKHTEALSGILITLKEIINPIIIENIITLPEKFKFFPTDLLSHWFFINPKETISSLSNLCDSLCDSDSRDLEKAKNLLLHLTLWIFRTSSDIIKKIPVNFIQTNLNNLVLEFDDDNIFTNLIPIITNKQK